MSLVKLLITCPSCGMEKFIDVDEEKLDAWIGGKLIQDAFPDLSPQEREEIKTGFCEKCWNEMWKEVEDDRIN